MREWDWDGRQDCMLGYRKLENGNLEGVTGSTGWRTGGNAEEWKSDFEREVGNDLVVAGKLRNHLGRCKLTLHFRELEFWRKISKLGK